MTCSICKQPVVETIKARLYINGQPTGMLADIHAINGHPAHPEGLKGVGGPMVGETDTWEWRVER